MRRLLLAAAVLALIGTSAMAEPSAKWSQVGPWQIMVDRSIGNSCFMISSYGNGTMLRVGFNNLNNSSYFFISNPAWQSLEAGKQYQIAGQFDGGQMVSWTANAVNMSGSIVLSVGFDSPSPTEVLTIFGQRLNFKLYYHGNLLANMNLNGTAAAIAETINCNQQVSAKNDQKSDPFLKSAPVVTDAFHQS
jgi:hypothetical protein